MPLEIRKASYIWQCKKCKKEFEKEDVAVYHEKLCTKNNCYRCGRKGHWFNQCYATFDIHGNYLK